MNNLFYAFFIFIITACDAKSDKYIKLVFESAGENREQLENALEYYSDNLKKRASTRFLVENMIGKSVLDSNSISSAQPYFNALIEYHQKYGSYQNDIQKYICDSVKKSNGRMEMGEVFERDTENIEIAKNVEI